MGKKFRGSDKLGKIIIGFGILFSGLLNMTGSVNQLLPLWPRPAVWSYAARTLPEGSCASRRRASELVESMLESQ